MSSTLHSFLSWQARWARLLPLLALALAALAARAQEDPPGRVAAVTERQGSVVFAPAGEPEWVELPANRPLTQADRLWTDQGARVELHVGNATLHMNDLSQLGFVALDDNAAQMSLTQGSLNAHVRELRPRENFEVDTPNLSVRALRPGDWRVDVDPDGGTTRVAVHSGSVIVYGEHGESRQLHAGQQAMFVARDLEDVEAERLARDGFDLWSAERNRAEDQSISARYVPREVIGYQQLDQYGTWNQDATYGAVWYPTAIVADWAPYRNGRWAWIQPWGWTWIDDAPWGFAPFHYGRWALIGSRWAWVPGRIAPRPVYSPALVVFVGGGSSSVSFSIGSSPAIGWYPLAPGEAWYPTYRCSPVYLRGVNYYMNVPPRWTGVYVHSRHDHAITTVRVDDFGRGRPVWGNWYRVSAQQVATVPATTVLPRPSGNPFERTAPSPRLVQQPRAVALPPAGVNTGAAAGFGGRMAPAPAGVTAGPAAGFGGRVAPAPASAVRPQDQGQPGWGRFGRMPAQQPQPAAPPAQAQPAPQQPAPQQPAAPQPGFGHRPPHQPPPPPAQHAAPAAQPVAPQQQVAPQRPQQAGPPAGMAPPPAAARQQAPGAHRGNGQQRPEDKEGDDNPRGRGHGFGR